MLLLIDKILSVLAPHICKGCGDVGTTYCSRCINDTLKQDYRICLICQQSCKSHNLCSKCRKRFSCFDNLICVGERQGALKRLINDYKFKSEVASCKPIAELLYLRLASSTDEELLNDNEYVIIPIPTIPNHIRQRGFDHMLYVARELSKLTGWQVNSSLLYRTDNLVQHEQSFADRHKLASKSFAIREGKLANGNVNGKKYRKGVPQKVIILDDIWTSGATMIAVAKLLRSAGVKEIIGYPVLRQPKNKAP